MLDKFRETAITWDKANRKIYEPLRASAGDNKGRKLSVQIVNNGVVENLSGASLSLFWETKDKAHNGLDAFETVDAAKGEFEIYYKTGMLSNEGALNANLVLVDTSGRVVSEPFTITVFKGIDDDAIQSSDSFTALTEALAQVGTINNKADRDELLALESTFEQNKLSVDQQLQQTEKQFKGTANKRPMISIDTDDGKKQDIDVLFPFLQVRGVPLTVSIPPIKIGQPGRMTWADIHTIVNAGGSVSSHTYDEVVLTDQSLSEVERQLKLSKEAIVAQGFTCDYLTYPTGAFNKDIARLAKKYYKASATVRAGVLPQVPNSQELPRTSLFTVPTEETYGYIDDLVANNKAMIIYTHGEDFANNPNIQTKLNDIIVYAKSKGVEFTNFDNLWETHGNILDLGFENTSEQSLVISASGDIKQNGQIRPQIRYVQNGSVSDKLDTFDDNTITYSEISSASQAGFPENRPGNLITYRVISGGYAFQQYKIHGQNKMYQRSWVGATETGYWTPFIMSVGGVPTIKTVPDEVSINSRIDMFMQDAITITQISEVGKTGFPENKAGTLITNRVIEFSSYNFQEYHIYGENRVWRRTWRGNTATGGWTPFTRVTDGRKTEGVALLTANTTSVSVVLTGEDIQPDSGFGVILGVHANINNVWTTNRTVNGFTINVASSMPSDATISWKIVR